jgi:hypothetical protein
MMMIIIIIIIIINVFVVIVIYCLFSITLELRVPQLIKLLVQVILEGAYW